MHLKKRRRKTKGEVVRGDLSKLKSRVQKGYRFHQYIFGCKVNRYDAELLRASLLQAGCEEVDDPKEADFLFVHSCVVTHKAERDVRRVLRRTKREGVQSILSGCFTPASFTKKEVNFWGSPSDVAKFIGIELLERTTRQKRARATLKVQEGCRFSCSYCIVPQVRGRSRSRPLKEIISEMRVLLEAGHEEVVITGTQVGDWGWEWKKSLLHLLQEIAKQRGDFRVRISSILPMYVDKDLVSLFVSSPERFCPHFHIPLQSGSPKVLKDMMRPYKRETFERATSLLIEELRDVSIGTDVIAGFPTEQDQDFRETLKIIEEIPFSYLHVFEYSGRPDTEASRLSRLPPSIVKERVNRLLELGTKKRMEYARRFLGRELSVVVEKCEGGRCFGTSENYLRVIFEGQAPTLRRKRVLITEILSLPPSGPAIVKGIISKSSSNS